MNSFEAEYQSKLCTPDDVLAQIKSGDVINCGGSALEPQLLLSRLHELRGRVERLTVLMALGVTPYPFLRDPAFADTFRVPMGFMQGAGRAAHRFGIAEAIPTDLHDGYLHWQRRHRPDWCFVQASPMNERGEFSVSLSLLREMEGIEGAKRVVLEVNPNIPWLFGEGVVKIADVDMLLEAKNPLPVVPSAPAGPVEQEIARHIAALIHDGDTLQLGIGSIPDAVCRLLLDRHDLGIHTEMITNSMAMLLDAGAVTNAKKTLDPGLTVGSFAMGLPELYEALRENPKVYMRRAMYVNDPFVIAQQDNFVSVNNALAVDLGGQVCSESIGPLIYSGTGGQFNTAYGAFHAKNGRGVIALRSTANTKQGRVSTITALLPPGSVVSLSRNYVDYIVTEYGAAHLRGLSVRERVRELVRIAHPDYRGELERDAQKYLLW